MLSKDSEKTKEGDREKSMKYPAARSKSRRMRNTAFSEKTIRLTLTSKEEDIREATEQGSRFLRSQGLAKDTIRAQALLFHELVRTGIEYGTDDSSHGLITADIRVNAHSILTEIRHPIDAGSRSRLDELDRTVQFIKGHQDPFEAYRRMKEGWNDPTPASLNLARITCEAGAVLDYFVEEDDFLNLSALRNLDRVHGQSRSM